MGKNIAEYMKVRLRPIQERISSLRTQIHQYEDMDRIQGGPSHFMATTLKELEKLENKLTDVDLGVSLILRANGPKYSFNVSGRAHFG